MTGDELTRPTDKQGTRNARTHAQAGSIKARPAMFGGADEDVCEPRDARQPESTTDEMRSLARELSALVSRVERECLEHRLVSSGTANEVHELAERACQILDQCR